MVGSIGQYIEFCIGAGDTVMIQSSSSCMDGAMESAFDVLMIGARLPADVFKDIYHLPNLISDDKYKSFEDVYESQTSAKYCPSLSTPGAKNHGMPFPPSAQYAKNVKVVLQCGA